MGDLAILVPVLKRPHRVRPLLESARGATPNARVLFIPDPDDEPEREAIRKAGAEELPVAGNYAAKINTAVRATNEPFLLFGADDIQFRPGWFEAAKAKVKEGIGVIGTQDLGNQRVLQGTHSTHPLVTRWYAELPLADGQPGPLYEGYEHNFCDTEFVQTAQSRNAWTFAPDAIVEHLHYLWGKSPTDSTYAKGQAGFQRDHEIYLSRARHWAFA